MKLVICMSGFNTRFHNAGFDIPKYLLPWNNYTIIREILNQLTKEYTFDGILLLANKRDIFFKDQLINTTEMFSPEIHYISDTIGQAHTAAVAAKLCNPNDKFLVHNADTIVANRDLSEVERILSRANAFVDIFAATSPKYCYVNTIDNRVTEIAEKKVISACASSGLYGFGTAELYIKKYNETLNTHTGSEIYIADVLAHMLRYGANISVNLVNSNDSTIVIGSPEEYSIAQTHNVNNN